MPTPRALVVCYSRTGTTRTVADALAAALHCPIEHLIDTRPRAGGLRLPKCLFDAVLKRTTTLRPLARNPEQYDLVIVATPVWANSLPPATRTFLAPSGGHIKRVAFVCTQNASGAGQVFREMTEVGGRAPVAVLALRNDQVRSGRFTADVDDFVSEVSRLRVAA